MPVCCSLAELKERVGLSQDDSTQDVRLTQILIDLDEVIAKHVGRARVPGKHPLQSVSSVEYYDGQYRQILALKRRPVTEIVGVWVDGSGAYGYGSGAFPTSSARTIGTDFAPTSLDESEENGGLLIALNGGMWPVGLGNIKVEYVAGYSTIPRDIRTACCSLAVAVLNEADKGGRLKSEDFGEYSYELLDGSSTKISDEIATARAILARYKEVSL